LQISSVFIRVHPRPIKSLVIESLANMESVFICVHLRLSVSNKIDEGIR